MSFMESSPFVKVQSDGLRPGTPSTSPQLNDAKKPTNCFEYEMSDPTHVTNYFGTEIIADPNCSRLAETEGEHSVAEEYCQEKMELSTQCDKTSTSDLSNIDETKKCSNGLLEKLFDQVLPINFPIDGGELVIFGDQEMAERISKKFKIMRKLAHLVGCGLDCHFRLVADRFRLLMLVRGFPLTLFGASIIVVPDLTDIRKQATTGEFVEYGQREFFETILRLFPRKIKNGEHVLIRDLIAGDETTNVQKFYDFLKNIRGSVFSNVSSVPEVWTGNDWSEEVENVEMPNILNLLRMIGDFQLVSREKEFPGYGDQWLKEWNLTNNQTFSQLMEEKFNEL